MGVFEVRNGRFQTSEWAISDHLCSTTSTIYQAYSHLAYCINSSIGKGRKKFGFRMIDYLFKAKSAVRNGQKYKGYSIWANIFILGVSRAKFIYTTRGKTGASLPSQTNNQTTDYNTLYYNNTIHQNRLIIFSDV